jgi:hypothetical protein
MADRKITELTSLTGAQLADDDVLVIVDTSANETKKISYTQLRTRLDDGTGFVRVTGDTMTGSLNIERSSGYASMELLGPSGAFIDFRNANADDYDGRVISDGTNFTMQNAVGPIFLTAPAGQYTRVRNGFVANEDGGSDDFRVEGDTNTHALFLNADNNRIGIKSAAPVRALSVVSQNEDHLALGYSDASWFGLHRRNSDGALILGGNGGADIVFSATGGATFNEGSENADFRVESDAKNHMFFIDAGLNRVAVGTNSPTATFHSVDETAVGSNLNDARAFATLQGHAGNTTALDFINLRTSQGGTDWTTAATRMQMRVDSTEMGYLQFNGASGQGSVAIGSGSNSGGYHLIGENARFTTSGVVFNELSNDKDFRVESDNVSHMIFVDASADRVSMGSGAPYSTLEVARNGHNAGFGNVRSWAGAGVDKFYNNFQAIPSGQSLDSKGGMHIGSNAVSDGLISVGAYYYNGGYHTAVGTEATATYYSGDHIRFYSNTGLTAGSDFAPTNRFEINASEVVVNETSADIDFRVESDTSTHAIIVDGETSNVGINYVGSPAGSSSLNVGGNRQFTWNIGTENSATVYVGSRTTSDQSNSFAVSGVTHNTYYPAAFVIDSQYGDHGVSNNTTTYNLTAYGVKYNGWNGNMRFNLTTGTTVRNHLFLDRDENVFNDPSHDIDFRVESDSRTHALFVDAGNNLVGINHSGGGNDASMVAISNDPKHPAIKIGSHTNVNGFNLIGDNYQGDETTLNIGLGYSGANPIFARSVKPSTTTESAWISSQDTFAAKPAALEIKNDGFRFYHTKTSATTATDSAVALTNFFHISSDGVIANDAGADADFRVESDSNTHALFVDASNNSVSMGASNGSNYGARLMASIGGGSTNAAIACVNTATSGTRRQIDFFDGSSTARKGSIETNGTATTYNTTSDRRLKTDIQPISDGTEKLMQMQPVKHKWKADPDGGAVHGFIAQDMQQVIPEAVSGEDGGDDMMSMDYGRITPVLVAALQDAHKKIEALETRLAALEAS